LTLIYRFARLLSPDFIVQRVSLLTPGWLARHSVAGLIVDLDNTLCRWQSETVPEDIKRWLASLRKAGIPVCLASNTHDRRRLNRMAQALQLPYVDRVIKPRRSCFRKALSKLNVPSEGVAVVGDQMFTDVLGGKRSSLRTIMVKPIHSGEFVGTRASRVLEGLFLAWFGRGGLLPAEDKLDSTDTGQT